MSNIFSANKAIHQDRVKLLSSRDLQKGRKEIWICSVVMNRLLRKDWDENVWFYLLNVDQLANVHVIVAAANIWTHRLHYLPDHGYDDVSPRERERLTVKQLLQQSHHVIVVGRSEWRDWWEKKRKFKNVWSLTRGCTLLSYQSGSGFQKVKREHFLVHVCSLMTYRSLSIAFFSPFSSLSWSRELWCQPSGVKSISLAFSSTRRLNKDSVEKI